MGKQIDYPRATLKSSLELAVAIDELGGSCSIEMAADKLNKKVSGAFQALTGSAVRYGLITSKKGQLEVTGLFRDHKLSYTKKEADTALKLAFLTPTLFRSVFDRFEGRELPIEHMEKLLIREFSVPDQISSRVSKYFLEGAKQCNLLGAENILSTSETQTNSNADHDSENQETDAILNTTPPNNSSSPITNNLLNLEDKETTEDSQKFSVRIKGPGMDSVITINDEEDLLITRAMLKKIEKKLNVQEKPAGSSIE
tara:strand:- start:467 stop:1234 length:768 start_codon:yes stop_codon:yes gene_type:complete